MKMSSESAMVLNKQTNSNGYKESVLNDKQYNYITRKSFLFADESDKSFNAGAHFLTHILLIFTDLAFGLIQNNLINFALIPSVLLPKRI